MAEAFLTHQPILSRQGRIIASRLLVHVDPDDAAAMENAVATLRNVEEFWPTDQQAYFLSFSGAPLTPRLFDWMVPENATLEIRPDSIQEATRAPLLKAVHDSGASLCLAVDAHIAQAIGAGFAFRFLGFDAGRFPPTQMQLMAVKLKSLGIPLAFNVDTPAAFKACTEAGMHGCSGWFCKQPTRTPGKALAPNQAHLVRLLNLVRNNADVAQIETALKRDVAVSYKLLRYINSAGFGLSCEIQSFRHAVTMLGYDKLHKWLSLLLITANKDALAPAVMQAVLTRARLMELIGEGFLGKDELDNLFITGAFSMLDTLLGVTMDKALGEMHLPDVISEALLSHTGVFAPFYELALACESADSDAVAASAAALGLDATRVNAALLQALSFASTMSV